MKKFVTFKFWIFAVTRDCASKLHSHKLLFWLPKFEQINLWVRESAPSKVLHTDGAYVDPSCFEREGTTFNPYKGYPKQCPTGKNSRQVTKMVKWICKKCYDGIGKEVEYENSFDLLT